MTLPGASTATSSDTHDTDELPRLSAETDSPASRRVPLLHPISLLAAAVVGGAMAYSFDTSAVWAIAAVGVAQALLVLSWILLTGVPGRLGAVVICLAAAGSSDAVVWHWHQQLGPLVAVLGLSVLALFAYQLLRGRRRTRVVESLSGAALVIVAGGAFAALIELRHQVDGTAMSVAVLLCATAALVAGHLIDWVWSPLRLDPAISRGLPGVVASVLAGAAVSLIRLHDSVEFTGERAALVGGALALITALFAVGAAYVGNTAITRDSSLRLRALQPIAGPLFAFALMSPVGYLLCLALRA